MKRLLAIALLIVTLGACSQSLDFHDEATRCIERTHLRFLGVEYRDKEIVWDRNPCHYPFNVKRDKWGFPVWGRD